MSLGGRRREMADSREKRATEIQDAIRQILYRDWDPVGVCGAAPEDEYDSYIGGVYQILASSRSEEALIQFLAGAVEDILGAPESAPERLRSVTQKLIALDVRL
jgi:hypothetical protein